MENIIRNNRIEKLNLLFRTNNLLRTIGLYEIYIINYIKKPTFFEKNNPGRPDRAAQTTVSAIIFYWLNPHHICNQ